MIVSGGIVVRKDELKDYEKVKALLTFPNPEYESTLKNGSKWLASQMPKTVCFLRDLGGGYCQIPRNFPTDYLRAEDVSYEIVKDTIIEAFSTEIVLRPYQADFLREIKEKQPDLPGNLPNDLVLNMPVGHGKTLAAIQRIAEIGERTLILVPTKYLQRQWINRIQTFYPKIGTPRTGLQYNNHIINYNDCIIYVLLYTNILQIETPLTDFGKKKFATDRESDELQGSEEKEDCFYKDNKKSVHPLPNFRTPLTDLIETPLTEFSYTPYRFSEDEKIDKKRGSKKSKNKEEISAEFYEFLVNNVGHIVVDECFVGDTLVSGNRIDTIKIGDLVESFNHSTNKVEMRKVLHVFKKKAKTLCKVTFSDGSNHYTTPEHPYYCVREGKYLPVKDMLNEYIIKQHDKRSNYLLRRVRKPHKSIYEEGKAENLQKEHSLFRKVQGREEEKSFREVVRFPFRVQQKICLSEDEGKESYVCKGSEGEGFNYIEKNRTQTYYTRRKREATTCSTSTIGGCLKVEYRSCSANKEEKRRLSKLLQDRYSKQGVAYRSRGGRRITQFFKKKGAGQEERSIFRSVRVENIEILKQGSNGGFGQVCQDGYVYNIEVEENNNYFVEGVLVHNCHRIAAKTWIPIIERFPAKYRTALTATFRRQDGMEKMLKYHFGNIYTLPNQFPLASLIGFRTGITAEKNLNAGGKLSFSKMDTYLAEHEKRNDMLITLIDRCLDKGRKILFLSKRREGLERLHQYYIDKGVKSYLVVGGQDMEEIQKTIEKEAEIVFGIMQLAQEGLDIDSLDTLILQHQIKDIEQAAGRIRRLKEGKKKPVILYPIDEIPACMAMYKATNKYAEGNVEYTKIYRYEELIDKI